ncbi:MAG: MotA/TolQ/ExbB proton channel family protein [Paludibacteraceae bacterium]|nr:MotA/TolQ/ExbB proton channel family protein [Paludibacteraceae bacterium]
MTTLTILQAGVQVATDAAQKTTMKNESLFSIVAKGGWILIPISLMLIIAIYIIIVKILQLKDATNNEQNLTDKICDLLHDGKVESAVNICQASNKPAAKVLATGLKTLGHPIKDIQDAMEGEARQQIDGLNRNMQYLGVISSIAPMFGFLGTIFGVIKIFYSISLTDNISIGIISEGLYQKMISSASGLLVGIVAYTAFHLINSQIDKITSDIEKQGNKLVSALREN